jgi:hypothetical protein
MSCKFNFLVATSNLIVGIPTLYWGSSSATFYVTFAAMVASFIYHLSETKHDLPGLPHLNKYSWQLLQIDRFFAVIAALYIAWQYFYFMNWFQNEQVHTLSIVGFIFLYLSELVNCNDNPWWFTITHSIWHFCAFSILAVV